mmetsp:Transcript_17744/g.54161  ORF Transcript_17744/g.54161 Transcript_17744/m.54161 type:complete len:174 (-) Transcript_17744:436-957(-)|eukprot:CAMPEP_0198664008 /NCGR_PEP_ID=MMETSP1467-20131203/54391_1 /TAXON_ID=1462469 /ORGANISM="unid. sp., Strain CCMP2135" /LENGTH=173 /DNA_ID=CAMNT_0044400559 /DNA_START=102 /DNA_END=623 /DNA_ORIENTATION=+
MSLQEKYGGVYENEDALKVLKVVLRNVGKGEAKFRRVRLDGTAGAKLQSCPAAMALLRGLGFQEFSEDDGSFLVLPEGAETAPAAAVLADLQPTRAPPEEKLSLKAQARREAEKRRALEQEAAKKHRAEVKKQIERDNRARKEDANWRPGNGVSKGGKDINTFRGKYGEDKGG